MIVYNGISIDSVAPVMIEDIKVSPIHYNPVVRPRAVRFGSEWVRMGGGERTITISFALLVKNPIERQAALLALSNWARTDAEYRLELPTDHARYLVCVCTAKPEPSTRAWWENKLRLVFTCYNNPYWTANAEKSVACGTAFNVLGNAPPLMRIERTLSSTASNQAYSNGVQTMTFSEIPAGSMVIDLNAQTAQVNGVSFMHRYLPAGSFIIPRTGAQTITGTGTVKYRERWE
jgi:phage-related protein